MPSHREAILSCALALLGCGRASPAIKAPQVLAAQRSAFHVGQTTFAFFDATRQRPLPTRLWYPATAEAVGRDFVLERIFLGRAAIGAQLTELVHGGHFVFMALCNDLGRRVASAVCNDPDPAVDRALVQRQVGDEAVAFFDRGLSGDGLTQPTTAPKRR